MKIAFCFLTCKNLNNLNLWKQFFVNNKDYNIYIHNKEEINGEYSIYSIPNKIDTKWGDISLVKASIRLFEEAFKDEDNEYFILLSESCIPLTNYDSIKNKIFNLDCSIVNKFNNDNKQYQWVLFKRDLVEWFINNIYFDDYIDYKPPDEYYFINLIKRFNLEEKYKISDIPLTYVNWSDLSENPKYRIQPKTYDKLTNQEYNSLLKSGYLFARKFSDICQFNLNFIKNINIDISLIIKKWIDNNTVYWIQFDEKENQIISLVGNYQLFYKNKIDFTLVTYDDIIGKKIIIPEKSKIMISGNYNNSKFNQKIINLQENYDILILPHSNLNKFLIKKFNKNIIALAKDEKTFNYYQENNITTYLTIDTGFYIDINKINIEMEKSNKHTKIMFNDKIIKNYKYEELNKNMINLFNDLLHYNYIKTNQINIIISCLLLNIKCEIMDKSHSLNKYYFNHFLNKLQNIKFVNI
jgi:hypothetical protein